MKFARERSSDMQKEVAALQTELCAARRAELKSETDQGNQDASV
jgi:hypothetical protein